MIKDYLTKAVLSFENDPADSDYQKGYLNALIDAHEEVLNEEKTHETLSRAELLILRSLLIKDVADCIKRADFFAKAIHPEDKATSQAYRALGEANTTTVLKLSRMIRRAA